MKASDFIFGALMVFSFRFAAMIARMIFYNVGV